ncbi:hypothetical protein B7463_g6584, partial [Scytalidium lignicola]
MGMISSLISILPCIPSKESKEKKKAKQKQKQQEQQRPEQQQVQLQADHNSPAIITRDNTTTQSQSFPPSRQPDSQHPPPLQHPSSDFTAQQEQEGRLEETVASEIGIAQRTARIEAPQPLSLPSSSGGQLRNRTDGDIRVSGPPTPRPTPTPIPLAVGTAAIKTTSRSSDQTLNTRNPRREQAIADMASDEDYAAFLDKANRDPNEGIVKTASNGKVEFTAVSSGVKVPEVLSRATKDAFYISDADEEFVPVCLTIKSGQKGLPDEVTFASLINHPNPEEAEVSIMDVAEWDPQGQYKDVVDATREAAKGSDVRVYRIAREGARVEYWVVGIEGKELVGAKVLAIES